MSTTYLTSGLNIELWVLYSVGLFFIACRTTARRLHFRSFRKFQTDDYIMLFVILTFTGVFVTTYQVAKNGSNYNLLRPDLETAPTPKQIDQAVLGSKMAFALEECLITTVWLLKACILLMYRRLTLGRWQHTAIKLLAWYCVLGFVVMQVLLFALWCRPFHQYWAVPPKNSQCATYFHHMIVASVFNLSSDLCIIAIPLPILITSLMPLRRKLILCCVFSLGVFVILAAVLNRYYNFSQKYSLIYLRWYIGEVLTAVVVANIPLCWPLFRRVFPLDSWGCSRNSSSNNNTSGANLQAGSLKRPTLGSTTIGLTSSDYPASTAQNHVLGRDWGARDGHGEVDSIPMPLNLNAQGEVIEPDLEKAQEGGLALTQVNKTVGLSQATS